MGDTGLHYIASSLADTDSYLGHWGRSFGLWRLTAPPEQLQIDDYGPRGAAGCPRRLRETGGFAGYQRTPGQHETTNSQPHTLGAHYPSIRVVFGRHEPDSDGKPGWEVANRNRR